MGGTERAAGKHTHTAPYVKQIADGKWLHSAGSSAAYSLTAWGGDGLGVGGRFNREGTYAYLRLILVVVWQKPAQHCETIILQLKIEKKKEKQRECFSANLG